MQRVGLARGNMDELTFHSVQVNQEAKRLWGLVFGWVWFVAYFDLVHGEPFKVSD